MLIQMNSNNLLVNVLRYIMIVIFIVSCSLNQKLNYQIENVNSIDPIVVSFEELNQFTEKYDSANIEIEGYFKANFEDVSVYKSKDDYNDGNKKSAIWVNFNKNLGLYENDGLDKLDGKMIKIRGFFNSRNKGHLNQYLGEIDDVYSVKGQK